MKTVIVQKAAVFDEQGRLLTLRRSDTDVRRPLQWDLPGGFLDEGEEFVDGVRREIKEEAGLDVGEIELIFSKTEVRDWKDEKKTHTSNVVFMFYKTQAKSTNVEISYEHTEFKWMTPNEALTQFEYYLQKEFLQHALANQLL